MNNSTYYLRARNYDPTTGRFLTEDPAQAGVNWYAYCNNNPIRYIDPFGLVPRDHDEFGKNSAIAKSLDELGEQWNATKDNAERKSIHQQAELLRGIARVNKDRGQ